MPARKRFSVRAIILTALFGCCPGLSTATPNNVEVEQAARQAERLQNDMSQRIEQQRVQDLQSDKPPTRLQLDLPARAKRDSGQCRDIHTVEIKGVTLLRSRIVTELQNTYQNRCLGVSEIEQLMADVTAAYISRGYIAARAYLPGQDLTQGRLILEVEEGRLESVEVDDGGHSSINPVMVYPGALDNPLNLRELEQALDQINRLASNNARMSVMPGLTPGGSRVVFNNTPTRPYRLNLTYDNSGQKATGREQLGFNFALDNPLGLNDFLSLTHRRALPYDSGKQASYFNNMTYMLPYGANTFSLSLSDSEYASMLQTAAGNTLYTRGDSQTYTLQWDRVLWRGPTSQWSASAALTQKEQGNYLNDAFLAVSSRRLSVFDLDTQYTTQLLGGAFNVSLGISRGLALLGSVKDPANLPAWVQRAQFEKYDYSLSWFRPFSLLGKPMSFTSQVSGQHAVDSLYGSERISLGSPYTVRGFNEESISGDNGYFLRNELALTHFATLPGGYTAELRPFIGVDYGKAWSREEPAAGDMSSASVGVTTSLGPTQLGLTWSVPLDSPEGYTSQGDTLSFNLSITL